MLLRNLLREELQRRQRRNRRYSMRAFARDLAVHHSTLSRVLRGRQRATPATLITIAAGLRLGSEVVNAAALAEADGAVRAATGRDAFRPDSRWIAMVTGLSVDDVNAALHRLLRNRMLLMDASGRWVAL